jgi:hypothetical protein
MPEIRGGCLCSAVRYTASAEPALVGVCHCRDCQKFTGSAFGFFIGVPRSAFEIQGALKTFTKLGDSGNPIVRRFCPECGSSVVEEPPGRPDLAIINAGTLDDPSAVTPTMEIYCDRELPWVRLDGTQRYPGMPG